MSRADEPWPDPWLVLHRAAEPRRRLATALRCTAADYLEIDVRRGARAECRHDALLLGLPFLTQRHYLPRLRLRRLWLADLGAESLRVSAALFLDLKVRDPAILDQTLSALESSGLVRRTVISTPHWAHLDRLAERAPRIGRFYSVGRGRHDVWGAYERRIAEGRAGQGASLHRSVATRERLQRLRESGLRGVVYGVNGFDRGLRLLDDGAGGLVSDRGALIAAWRECLEPARD